MKVLVCGSRDWSDYDSVLDAMGRLVEERGRFTVMHGAARGADRLSGRAAAELGLEVLEYPADWDRFGRRAGYVRNQQMLDQRPDLVVAFHRDGSRGTAHMIELARKAGIEVEVHGVSYSDDSSPESPRVLNKRTDAITDGAVYVGRPTKWGNPFVIGRDGDRGEVVERYRGWLLGSPVLMSELHELRGKDLVCWCAPEGCHGDVLLELANR